MTVRVGKQVFENVKILDTNYQKENGKSFWVFITTFNENQFAVEYDPCHEDIFVY